MLPTLFLSHGSPMHALQPSTATAFWSALGDQLAAPRAILMASAHWETELPMLTTGVRPETIHDYSGFPAPLYRLRYPAPGAPDLARRAIELIAATAQPAAANGCRGLDHGAWVPLRYMYPNADIPVAQLSIQTSLGARHHLRLGRALAALAAEDVLVIGSGHITHNLREAVRQTCGAASPTAPYVEEFRDWLAGALNAHDEALLLEYRLRAPHALRAHPSEEHFLPLLVAYGAAGPQPRVERFELGVDLGVLAMDAYRFTPAA